MGTTLEILLAYRPGLKCQHRAGVDCEVIGFDFREENSVMVESLQGGKWEASWVNPIDLTPCLLAFEDLCTPLADGTVPAIEVARLAMSLGPDAGPFAADYPYTYQFGVREFTGSGARVRYTHEGTMILIYINTAFRVSIDSQDGGRHDQPDNYVGIINYLRSKHFAVGLTPDQFIRKTA